MGFTGSRGTRGHRPPHDVASTSTTLRMPGLFLRGRLWLPLAKDRDAVGFMVGGKIEKSCS